MNEENLYYDHVTVVCPANSPIEVTAFTSTEEEPRIVREVCLDSQAAGVMVTLWDEREQICDLNSDALPLVDKWLPVNRSIKPGHSFQIGLNNGTAAPVTMVIGYKWQVGK